MKLLIDIGHPAHVHYFKNTIFYLKKKGHNVFITARDKDVAQDLLKSYSLDFKSRGKGGDNILSKLLGLIKNDLLLLKHAYKFKPDLFLSFGSPYAAHAAMILRKPHICFSDTENAGLNHLLYKYFSSVIFTPAAYSSSDFGAKRIPFEGYMELCYLHPKYFQPDDSILDLLNVNRGEKYMILRFVSWQASHDLGHQGISLKHKIKCVKVLSKYAKVFITSEGDLPEELNDYQIKIPSNKMHDAIAFSSLLYGESATMASEAAVLGVPAIYLDDDGRGYTNEQEKEYGLVFNYSESEIDQKKSLAKAIEILSSDNLDFYKKQRIMLLEDKINVTDLMAWVLENYPGSVIQLRSDSSTFERFKTELIHGS